MKKLIKLEFNNTTRERKTEDSYSELYSHDKNNGSFEFEILNETLTTEQVTALFKFTESNKIWKTTGTVEGNKVKVTFDTTLITQNETVICYLYFDEEQRTSDTFRFKFKVKVSEIDKMSRYEVKERFINNTVIVDRLDVVTKTELQEALKNVGGITTEGLLTETKAEETYAKKTDAVDNTNFELVKNRVLALELKTDKDTVYDDSEVKERLTTLENKAPVDLSGYATKEELRNVSGSQPLADNLVTKQELEEKQYLTTHQDLSEYAKKSELYNDSDLKARVEVLEQKTDKDTVYDDTPLKERVTALESKAVEGGAYDDKPIRDRLDVLEAKHDNDTIYDDTEVKHRLTELENKPAVDTSVFVTTKMYDEGLKEINESFSNIQRPLYVGYVDQETAKEYLDSIPNLFGKPVFPPYAGGVLAKMNGNYPQNVQIFKGDENNSQFVDFDAAMYSLANSLPTGYSIQSVSQDINNKVLFLSNKNFSEVVPKEELKAIIREVGGTGETVDTSHFITNEILESKNYLTQHQPLDNLVTKEELNSKGYLTEHQPLMHLATTSDLEALRNIAVSKSELSKKLDTTEFNSFKDNVVTKTELAEKGYISDLSNYVTKEELHEATEIDYSNIVTTDELEPYVKKSELPAPYNDSALVSRINVLEAKTDKDTVYNDTEVKQRLTALENRPTTGGGLSTEDVATYTNNIIYVPNGNIVYDKNLKKLYIPKCNVHVGKTSYWCEAQEVSINGSAGFIVFNKAQKRIVGGSVNSTNDVLLGYYDNNIGNYYLNTFSKALKKKKIACLGDSITEGVKANGWQWHRYIDKYFKENGIETTIVNLGVGGTSVCTSSYVSSSLQPFVNRLNTIPTDADVIVIFGGTNDWGNNATLGTISDTGSSSFYGAYKYMLEWFANNRPNAKILTITPLKRYYRGYTSTWTNAQTTRNNKGQLLQDYVRAVKEVSEMYAIPCVDLHNESGLNPVLDIVRTKYMEDGLHPTAEGNKKMYPIILDKLKPLVKYD